MKRSHPHVRCVAPSLVVEVGLALGCPGTLPRPAGGERPLARRPVPRAGACVSPALTGAATAAASETTAASESETESESGRVTTVTLTEGKWKAAGIRAEPASQVALPSEVGVAGKVEANPDRRVEVRPRAAGVVREVLAKLGHKVRKGEVLAILDSPEIGTARLNLRGRQIELATARKELDWKQQVADNVARLIPAIRKGAAGRHDPERVCRSTARIRPRPSCSRPTPNSRSPRTRPRRRAPCTRTRSSANTLRSSHSTRSEGARAKLEAVLEQVRFDASHERTLADQKVRLAEAAVIDAAQRLRILGVPEEISQLLAHASDVAASQSSTSEDVTAYQLTAPFDGTILTKAAVPSQKADPTDVLFVLADLSTVWVMANVTESDLAVLPTLKEGRSG